MVKVLFATTSGRHGMASAAQAVATTTEESSEFVLLNNETKRTLTEECKYHRSCHFAVHEMPAIPRWFVINFDALRN
jgi:hypothetical protein